jgi:hypothetical protein
MTWIMFGAGTALSVAIASVAALIIGGWDRDARVGQHAEGVPLRPARIISALTKVAPALVRRSPWHSTLTAPPPPASSYCISASAWRLTSMFRPTSAEARAPGRAAEPNKRPLASAPRSPAAVAAPFQAPGQTASVATKSCYVAAAWVQSRLGGGPTCPFPKALLRRTLV